MTFPVELSTRTGPGDLTQKAQRTLGYLRKHFPGAFQSVRPLCRGIRCDLITVAKLQDEEVSEFLSFYVNTAAYLRACIEPGAMRCDLHGQAHAAVSDEDRAYAQQRLTELSAQRREFVRWLAFNRALMMPVMANDYDLPRGGRPKC